MIALKRKRGNLFAMRYRLPLIVTACILLLVCFMPSQAAHAYYNDVSTEYPAMQDLIPDGDVLTAADIPEGVYIVPAQTSSYMCKLYDPRSVPNDDDSAGKKALEDKCQITVAGGSITATFYISKAYTAFYFGTSAEAAMLTDDEGLDGSAYWFGTPESGYVYRMVSIPVAALNESFPMATYTGGQNFEKGKWYDRNVLLQAGDEVMNAIRGSSGDEPDDGGDNNDPKNEDDNKDDSGDDDGSDPDKENSDSPSDSDTEEGSGSGTGSNNGGTAAPTRTSSNGGDSNGGGADDTASSNAGDNTARAQTGATRTRTGIAMNVVEPNEPVVVEVQPMQMPEKETGFTFTLPLAIGCFLVVMVALGVGWRIWGYRRALSAPVPFAEQGSSPERKDT